MMAAQYPIFIIFLATNTERNSIQSKELYAGGAGGNGVCLWFWYWICCEQQA